MIPELESSYKQFMEKETGRDTYECKLDCLKDNFLSDA